MNLIIGGLHFCELLACVTGFFYWKKIKNTYWRWFPIYLLVVLLVEITGKLLTSHFQDYEANRAMYKYFGLPVQFFFFYWLFYAYFKNNSSKDAKWPLIGAAIYFICWLMESVFFPLLPKGFVYFSYSAGNAVLLALIILFFIRFINSEVILKYAQSMMFWVSIGLLSFYLLTFPFFAIRLTLYTKFRPLFDVYWMVSLFLDYIMYLFFTVAFVWGRPK